jgi:hypothetical protein
MKLSQRRVMKQYQIKFPHRFAALENLNDSEDISRAWEKTVTKSQLKVLNFCMNESSINHGFMKNIYSF